MIWELLVLILAIIPESEGFENNGECSYNFQVWRPREDVLQRLSTLEHQCVNNTLSWERELHSARNQVASELLSMRNTTHSLEKELLELKMEDVQLSIRLKDLEFTIEDLQMEQSNLLIQFEQSNIEGNRNEHPRLQSGSGRERVTSLREEKFKQEIKSLKNDIGRVKNGVGNLKAEWLLVKRDVQNLKSENSQIINSQRDIRGDTQHIKASTDLLREEHNEIKAENTKLRQALLDKTGGGTFPTFDDEREASFQKQIDNLEDQNNELQLQIENIEVQNAALKREVLAVAIAARNMSSGEINKVLSQIPGIPNQTNDGAELPKDCHHIYKRGFHTSGVYQIKPKGATQLNNVYCEMLNNTGWTVIQRRTDGLLSFNRGWVEYKFGFGGLYGEFWLGNQMLHQLTSQRQYHLRIDMWDWEGGRAYAEYSNFRVDSEENHFKLHVRGYRGTAGDSMSLHDEMAFSTQDSDNDLHLRNCAVDNKGGWWFNSCYTANPNGVYHTGWYQHPSQTFSDGIVWYTFKNSEFYSLRQVEMKIRPAYLKE